MNFENNSSLLHFNRRTLFFLSLVTLFGFSAAGLTSIYFFQGKSIREFFGEGASWKMQLLRGTFFGLTAVMVALVLVRSRWFMPSRIFFTGLIAAINPSAVHIFFYSLCAAVGEEILFRGAVQPHIGIWPASVLFIFLHGYLNPFNWPITMYGLFMIIISAGLGYLYELFGIYAAMVAHFIFDVAMFSFLKWNVGRE
ncbi:MAG TPA: CPBP family intramembrane glutamic endopeptidase [Chitinophagales bacterium]|nr:CPBP family intramembrane glutamic endopeptidase [Chitinophagales bacterium]